MSKQKKLKRASEGKASQAAPTTCAGCGMRIVAGLLCVSCSRNPSAAFAKYLDRGADRQPSPPSPRGRPKNPNARKNHLAVYVSDEDMQTARVESQKARMTMSDWARERLFGGAAKGGSRE